MEPEGFRVDEVPLYLPEGEGEHLYLRIEKRGIGTPVLVRRMLDAYGVKERDVGVAGRKDAHGITTQWLSVPAKQVPDAGARLAGDDCRVLEHGLHPRKLRLGFLRGNRFAVMLGGEEVRALSGRVAARAGELERRGVPAYFGAQRFGAHSSTLREAERFAAWGRPARSRKERFLVSAIQSAVFNHWLAARLRDGLLHRAIAGDVLMFIGGRSSFVCDDPVVDTERVLRGELVATGPLIGAEMRPPGGEALTRESRSLDELGVDEVALRGHPAFKVGDRRPALTYPTEVEVRPSEEGDPPGLRIAFTLPRGAYATVFLEEIFGAALLDLAFPLGD